MDEEFVILFAVAVIALIAAGAIFLTSMDIVSFDNNIMFSSQSVSMEVISNDTLSNGENFTINLEKDNKPFKNQAINVTFINSNGELNSMISKTNDDGIAYVVLDGVNVGNYTVNCELVSDNAISSHLAINLEVI